MDAEKRMGCSPHKIQTCEIPDILAVASTRPQAIVRDGKIVVRQMMKLTLSCDHRIVDGALGAKFTNAVKQKLEDIELWKRLAA